MMFKRHTCDFCGRVTNNRFCNKCLPERLEASGAIDLRDNHTIEDLCNGYIIVKPIDETKKITAKSFRESIHYV